MKPPPPENEIKDFADELAAMLPPERVTRAKDKARKTIFRLQLAELRRQMGIQMEEASTPDISPLSKMETRADLKISALIEYLDYLGLGMEITVYPKNQPILSSKEVVLLRT